MLAAFNIHKTSKTTDHATKITVTRREDKYTALSTNYDFIVIALKTLGPLGTETSTSL